MTQRAKDALVCVGFGLAIVIATAPLWRILAFGANPTFDQLLELAICGGPLNR